MPSMHTADQLQMKEKLEPQLQVALLHKLQVLSLVEQLHLEQLLLSQTAQTPNEHLSNSSELDHVVTFVQLLTLRIHQSCHFVREQNQESLH